MTTSLDLPPALGRAFRTTDAQALGVSRSRLRGRDLHTHFAGMRFREEFLDDALRIEDPFARSLELQRLLSLAYSKRMPPNQFLVCDSAIAWYRGPLCDVLRADDPLPDIHVGVFGTDPIPRMVGVVGHRMNPATTTIRVVDGIAVASPASAWASMGRQHSLRYLVALGDFFCRVWRTGFGRPNAGKPALATREQLHAAIDAGKRIGNPLLREAAPLVREDSWSIRESYLRFELVRAHLPEPALNHDVFDDIGRVLACVDLAYPDLKIAIEYHGLLHGSQYAADVERAAALRAAGWIVIEVTAGLLQNPTALVARVRAAIRQRR
ncbi:MAG: hypothetical protein QM607_13810 [Microbacterium sp.]